MALLSVLLTASYLTYLIVPTPLQLFLLYFIIFHSSKSLRLFRFLLVYTAVSELTHAYGSWFTQITFSYSGYSYQVRSYGLCRYCPGKACFLVYELCQVSNLYRLCFDKTDCDFQMVSLTVTVSIILTFDFKYLSVSRLFVTRTRLSKSFLLSHIPVMLFLVKNICIVSGVDQLSDITSLGLLRTLP